jgi:hypothetical protein
MVSQWCYNGVTMVLQLCYNAVTRWWSGAAPCAFPKVCPPAMSATCAV